MAACNPSELARRLRDGLIIRRSGVLLLPQTWLGREDEVATRCGLGPPLDLSIRVLASVPEGWTRLGLDWRCLVRDHLDAIATAEAPPGRCLLITNVDVLLAALRDEERRQFWRHLRQTYKPARGLLLCVPALATYLFPPDEREAWAAVERLAVIEGDGRW